MEKNDTIILASLFIIMKRQAASLPDLQKLEKREESKGKDTQKGQKSPVKIIVNTNPSKKMDQELQTKKVLTIGEWTQECLISLAYI